MQIDDSDIGWFLSAMGMTSAAAFAAIIYNVQKVRRIRNGIVKKLAIYVSEDLLWRADGSGFAAPEATTHAVSLESASFIKHNKRLVKFLVNDVPYLHFKIGPKVFVAFALVYGLVACLMALNNAHVVIQRHAALSVMLTYCIPFGIAAAFTAFLVGVEWSTRTFAEVRHVSTSGGLLTVEVVGGKKTILLRTATNDPDFAGCFGLR